MPIRTNRGRAAVLRDIATWPLNSRRNLAISGAAAAVLLGAGVLMGNALSPQDNPGPSAVAEAVSASRTTAPRPQAIEPTDRTSQRSTPTTSTTPRTTSSTTPGIPTSTPPPAPAEPAIALAAEDFISRWVRPAAEVSPQQWTDRLRPLVIPESIIDIESVDPANIPASTVTGEPRILSATPEIATAEVPTDAGAVQVTLVARDGGRWLVQTWNPVES